MLPSSPLSPAACPGFCARSAIGGNESLGWSECGACSWGSRSSSDSSKCLPCDSPISLYDWLYLAFMVLLPMMTHCFCTHYYLPKKSTRMMEVIELLCCVFECLVAAIFSILLFPPRWSFRLWGCAKSNVREWYPALYNPVINHMKTMRCSYEVVFPLYSLPFVFLFCLLVSVLVFRSLLYIFVLHKRRDGKAYYYALLSLPKIMIIHALLAGLLYHSYAYLVIVWAVCSNAVHLSIEGKTKAPILVMLKRLFTSPVHLALLTINMVLLAFAIVALAAPTGSPFSLLSLLLVPVPALFYVVTNGLSHPTVLTEIS